MRGLRTKDFRKRRREMLEQQHFDQQMASLDDAKLQKDLQANIEYIQNIFGKTDDLIIRNFRIGAEDGVKAAVIYIDGLINSELINQFILKSVMIEVRAVPPKGEELKNPGFANLIKEISLTISEVGETDRVVKCVRSILSGDTVFLIDQSETAFLANTKGWTKRSISEPDTEAVVRGPRDGFTETLRDNTAQIRRRLRDPYLRVKSISVGKRTNTDIAIMYLENVVDPNILEEVMSRIQRIKVDGVFESGYIEQFIEDRPWSPFPQIQNSERPDKVAASILEGKIAIIVDGTPFVLIVPAIFSQFYQSPEDYYERFLIATLIRFIRILSLFIALLLPSLYIAFSSFHPEMIPSTLVIAMAAGRATVPFPSIIEAFLMEVTMEILREASVRLPGPIGPTIGIVGALVVGEAAVAAGIVSPIMVIIVALTTIGSFASPSYSASIALRMLRFPMMIAAGMFGLYGIMLVLIVIIMHLASLKSFGIPYMSPFTPLKLSDMKDTVVRFPLYRMITRPKSFRSQDPKRQKIMRKQEGR